MTQTLGLQRGPVALVLADALLVPTAIALLVDFETVVYVEAPGRNALGADELHLLGFSVAQGRRASERVEVILVEGAFGDPGLEPVGAAQAGSRRPGVVRALRAGPDPVHVSPPPVSAARFRNRGPLWLSIVTQPTKSSESPSTGAVML